MYDFAYFQIAAKAIVQKGDKILLLTTNNGHFDFPGGRMDKSEVDLSFDQVLKRELKEELGDNFKFNVGKLAFVSRRHYQKDDKDFRVLTIFFEVIYSGGTIQLSDEHSTSQWVKPESILKQAEKFISKDEYLNFKAYLAL